jgi:sugar O-acyltransferase (sialic acid O-acetyltransferase NeuD family)
LKPIVFWGATGHAKVLRELVERTGYKLVATFDNNPHIAPPFPDVPLHFGKEGFAKWRREFGDSTAGLVAIGGSRGKDRLEIQQFLQEHQIGLPVIVHPSAFVAANATLGIGVQVLAQAAVCVEVQMGDGCIVNTRASVDHECVLGQGVHVAPGAILAGCVTVEDFSMIGAGAIVLPRVRIGRNVIVGAGSVVTKDVAENKLVYGNPARIRQDNTMA